MLHTLSPGLDYSSVFSWATIIAVSNSSPTRICFYAALPTRCFRDPLRCSAGRLPPSPVLAWARPAPPRAGSAGSLHLPRPRLRPLWVAADGDQRQLSLGPPHLQLTIRCPRQPPASIPLFFRRLLHNTYFPSLGTLRSA